MMVLKDLIKALKRMKVETGSLVCLGCGYEHNCGVHGCRILRETVSMLEDVHLHKIGDKEDVDRAIQYFVIAVPDSEEQAKAYFFARKALVMMRGKDSGQEKEMREKWEPCKICKIKGLPEAWILQKKKFCQYCGKPLTEEAWEELERRFRG